MFLVVCSLASTASALEVIAEARIESKTGEPVQEELRFCRQGYERIVLKVQNGKEDGSNRVPRGNESCENSGSESSGSGYELFESHRFKNRPYVEFWLASSSDQEVCYVSLNHR